MAKRIVRSQADDAAAQEAPGKAKGRAKARREMGPQGGPEAISEQLEGSSRIQQAPGDAFASASPTPGGQPTDEEIRERAYQMYLERGGGDGMDFDDWLRAELELRQRR